jgi:hypothetical protein
LRPSDIAQFGIDQHVAPSVGEAYMVTGTERPLPGQFGYHYAAVIMVAGKDRLTYENQGGSRNGTSEGWKLEIYGPKEHQSFHEQYEGYGKYRHTFLMRRQPPPPDATRTYALFERYRSATGSEQQWLEKVLRMRMIQVWIHVKEKQNSLMADNVRVDYGIGGSLALAGGTVAMDQGQEHTFAIPISSVWPVLDPLHINIHNALIGDGLVGHIAWPFPYKPSSHQLRSGKALYEARLSM